MPFVEDLSAFFSTSEFATSASWGALTASVIFNTPTEEILGGRGVSNEYTAILPASEFPGITRGDEVVISGDTYTLRERPRLLDDGATIRFLNINPIFLGKDGRIPWTIMPDQLHLTGAGYQLWAEAIDKPLAEMMK